MTSRPSPKRRSMLLHGLRLVLTVPGPVLWTYAFNLALAAAFSLRLHAQLSSLLDHSLAAERLNSAFDLGTLYTVIHRLSYNTPSTGAGSYAGLPLYLLGYFIIVPGSLFCYAAECPSRLSILVSTGISFFWRFVRISLFTFPISAIILIPLLILRNYTSQYVDEHILGRNGSVATIAGWILILLVAALLRLYFDLVEVYTVQLAERFRPDGRADRRVRRTLMPALRTLRANLGRAYLTFLTLTLLGFAAVIFTGRIAAHMLAQPRSWPIFLLAQAGLFTMLATRFWQRAAETTLVCDNPLPYPEPEPLTPYYEPAEAQPHPPADAQPDPEPAAPSLTEPDPGVFHHETRKSEE